MRRLTDAQLAQYRAQTDSQLYVTADVRGDMVSMAAELLTWRKDAEITAEDIVALEVKAKTYPPTVAALLEKLVAAQENEP